jgi:hypothetical protein
VLAQIVLPSLIWFVRRHSQWQMKVSVNGVLLLKMQLEDLLMLVVR